MNYRIIPKVHFRTMPDILRYLGSIQQTIITNSLHTINIEAFLEKAAAPLAAVESFFFPFVLATLIPNNGYHGFFPLVLATLIRNNGHHGFFFHWY